MNININYSGSLPAFQDLLTYCLNEFPCSCIRIICSVISRGLIFCALSSSDIAVFCCMSHRSKLSAVWLEAKSSGVWPAGIESMPVPTGTREGASGKVPAPSATTAGRGGNPRGKGAVAGANAAGGTACIAANAAGGRVGKDATTAGGTVGTDAAAAGGSAGTDATAAGGAGTSTGADVASAAVVGTPPTAEACA